MLKIFRFIMENLWRHDCMFKCLLCFNMVINYVCADDFGDRSMYMMVSPDQHQRTPRLEDFFWTGSGDGPPPPPDPPVPTPSQPSSTLVRTTTVLATVYLDSYPPQAVTDKTTGECVLNCGDSGVPNSLEPEIPEDRRYWLLTVIQGSTPDSLQLKLAKLYQKAFLRQQERHLGIIKSLDAPTPKKKHDVHSFKVNRDNSFNLIAPSSTPLRYLDIDSSTSWESTPKTQTKKIEEPMFIDLKNSSWSDSNIPEFHLANIEVFTDKIGEDSNSTSEIKATKLISDVESWILVTPTVILKKREVSDKEDVDENKEELIDIPLEIDGSNESTIFKREIIKPEQQPPVQVHIQNITEFSDTGTVQIIYIVMVGGRAVPAAVAARDMRLVRDAEVAKELGAVITTKAEPYLKAAEGLEGEVETSGVHGTELWALAIGATAAILLLILLVILLWVSYRRKTRKSAQSLQAYRNDLLREAERNLKQVHEEKDGKLISVVSPSRTRPSSTLLPIYRAASASSSSTSSSDVSEITSAALRRRPKKPHTLRIAQKKRGTTDSLLEAAGIDSSDSGQPSAPHTPTSYLSMPSVNSFPRGNVVEPLSRILEPVSVRHLDIDSPVSTPKKDSRKETVPRRQMPSQLVRLGSIDKDPGVIGPLVWDLHCQRIKDASKPSTPHKEGIHKEPSSSRMRQRFNELMDDAFTLFGSAGSSAASRDTPGEKNLRSSGDNKITQARNDNVKLPGSPYTALDTVRGRSAGVREGSSIVVEPSRPQTTASGLSHARRPKALPQRTKAWGVSSPQSLTSRLPPAPTVDPAIILAQGHLPAEDPALPLISAIKSEIERVRDNAKRPT